MTVTDWAALTVSVMTILSGFAVLIRWLVKHYLSELKPNGGSSLRDEQTRQGATIQRLEDRVDEIYSLLVNKGAK